MRRRRWVVVAPVQYFFVVGQGESSGWEQGVPAVPKSDPPGSFPGRNAVTRDGAGLQKSHFMVREFDLGKAKTQTYMKPLTLCC